MRPHEALTRLLTAALGAVVLLGGCTGAGGPGAHEQARLQLVFPVALHPGVKVVRATARVEGAADARAVTLGDAPTPVRARTRYLVEGELDLALRGHRWQMTFTARVETGGARTTTPVRLLEELSATGAGDPLRRAAAGGRVEVPFRVRGRRGEGYGCIRRDGSPLPFDVTVGQGAARPVVPQCESGPAGGRYRLEWPVPGEAAPGAIFAVRAEAAFPAQRGIVLAFEVAVSG